VKTLREHRIKEAHVQASFEEVEQPIPQQLILRDSFTQVTEADLVPFQVRVQPVVEELVHDVLTRAVFAVEQERELQRITKFKEKYRSLRDEEEVKLSNAKRDFLELSEKVAIHESALRKVISIRLARTTIESAIESVFNRPCTTALAPISRLEELTQILVPKLVDQAYDIADVMRRIQQERGTVGNPDETFHTNTCVY